MGHHGQEETEDKTLLNQMFDDTISGGAIVWTISALIVITCVMVGIIA